METRGSLSFFGCQDGTSRLEGFDPAAHRSIVVLTGAGISADSAIATFRDNNGLWEQHRLEDVATPEAYERDPRLVWRFYSMRRKAALSALPNAAHHALAVFARQAEQARSRRVTL